MFRLVLLLICPVFVHASLECKGTAFGLNEVYTFDATDSGDLSLNAKTILNREVFVESSGIAKYSSTVSSAEAGISESYYIYLPEENSYTELIAISHNKKSMAKSRPVPHSETGNFIKFICVGTL